jgi:hypothetical protein
MYVTYLGTDIILNNKNKLSRYVLFIAFTLSLFFFRTVLGVVFLFSFILYYMVNLAFKKNLHRVISLIGLFFSIIVVIYYMSKIGLTDKIIETFGQSNSQTDSEITDKVSKGGGGGLNLQKVLIVPLLFVAVLIAPFPSIVFLDEQVESAWLFPGCIIKNIIIFFAAYGMWLSLKYVRKKSTLILSVLLSYSFIIAVAAQTTSPRYQLVSMPFLHIFCAVGLHNYTPQKKTIWAIYLLAVFIAIFSWNYFKLSIRGLI